MAPYNIPELFTPDIGYIAEQEGVDPDLFERLINAESYIPRLGRLDANAVSPKGAMGLGQLMPGTAAELGVDNPFDPVENLFGSARYLKNQIDDFGTVGGVAAYNAGPGNVRKYGGVPPFKETQSYVKKILGSELPSTPDFASAITNSASPNKYYNASPRLTDSPATGATAASYNRQQDLSRITGEITAIENQRKEAIEGLAQQGRMGEDQALALALTAIVPALLGLGFGGLQGAAVGAQAGASGVGVGLQGISNDIARRDRANNLMLQASQQQLTARQAEAKAIRDAIFDRQEKIEDRDVLEAGKDRRSQTMARAMKGPDAPLGDSQLKDIEKFREAAQTGVSALNTINNQFGSLLGNRYRKPDGSIDWEGVKGIGATKLGEIIGAGSVGSQLDSTLKEQISQFIKSVSGTAASDTERNYLEGIIKGGGILPSDLPTIYKTIERIVGNQANQASGYVDLAIAARGQDPRTSIMGAFPKAPEMGAGKLDLPPVSQQTSSNSGKYRIGQTARDAKGNVLTYTAEGWR